MLKQHVGVDFDDENACLNCMVTLLWHAKVSTFQEPLLIFFKWHSPYSMT